MVLAKVAGLIADGIKLVAYRELATISLLLKLRFKIYRNRFVEWGMAAVSEVATRVAACQV